MSTMMNTMLGSLTHDAESQMDTSYPCVTIGEYTIYPLEYCHEDEAAELFCRIAPRGNPGNPVLQGRPAADLKLLGRAMYRKTNKLRCGHVAFHKGKAVAIGCNWDVADGGVWEGSGLEMPASMAAHAQIGKTSFSSMKKHDRKTWFCAFYGVAPGHSATLFSYLGTMGDIMSHKLGFEDMFTYSMLTTLQEREGMYSRKSTANETHWKVRFADIDDASPAVSAELKELDGTLQLGLINTAWSLGDDYLGGVAKMTRIKSLDALLGPSQEMADKQLAWIKQTQSAEVHLDQRTLEDVPTGDCLLADMMLQCYVPPASIKQTQSAGVRLDRCTLDEDVPTGDCLLAAMMLQCYIPPARL